MPKPLTPDAIARGPLTSANFRETMAVVMAGFVESAVVIDRVESMPGLVESVAARGTAASIALADDVEAGRLTPEEGLVAGTRAAARHLRQESTRRAGARFLVQVARPLPASRQSSTARSSSRERRPRRVGRRSSSRAGPDDPDPEPPLAKSARALRSGEA